MFMLQNKWKLLSFTLWNSQWITSFHSLNIVSLALIRNEMVCFQKCFGFVDFERSKGIRPNRIGYATGPVFISLTTHSASNCQWNRKTDGKNSAYTRIVTHILENNSFLSPSRRKQREKNPHACRTKQSHADSFWVAVYWRQWLQVCFLIFSVTNVIAFQPHFECVFLLAEH